MNEQNLENIITGLNYHGDIFRKKIKKIFHDNGFKILGEEVPVSIKGVSKQADLIVAISPGIISDLYEHIHGDHLVVLVIECKKVHTNSISYISLTTETPFKVEKCSLVDSKFEFKSKSINSVHQKLKFTDDLYRYKNNEKNEKKILQKDAVRDTLIQNYLTYLGYLNSANNIDGVKLPGDKKIIFIPTVITNGDIIHLNIDIDNISNPELITKPENISESSQLQSIIARVPINFKHDIDTKKSSPTLLDLHSENPRGILIINSSNLIKTIKELYVDLM